MSPPIYVIGEKKPEKKLRASKEIEPVTSANTLRCPFNSSLPVLIERRIHTGLFVCLFLCLFVCFAARVMMCFAK